MDERAQLDLIERAARSRAGRGAERQLAALLAELTQWSQPVLDRLWRNFVADPIERHAAVREMWLTALVSPATNCFADYLQYRIDKAGRGEQALPPVRYFLGSRSTLAQSWLRTHVAQEELRICNTISKSIRRITQDYGSEGMLLKEAQRRPAHWVVLSKRERMTVRHLAFEYRRFLMTDLVNPSTRRVWIGAEQWETEQSLTEPDGAPGVGATSLLRAVFRSLNPPFPLNGAVLRDRLRRWLSSRRWLAQRQWVDDQEGRR